MPKHAHPGTVRLMLRRNFWLRFLLAVTPFSVAAQFVGHRSPTEIAISIFFIALGVGAVTYSCYLGVRDDHLERARRAART